MNLVEWQRKPIFKEGADDACQGELTISFAARHNGEPHPAISEQGRRFLATQLHRLTPAHVRALFRAARVDQIAGTVSRGTVDPIDEWVAVFQDKVRQIDAQRCRPIP